MAIGAAFGMMSAFFMGGLYVAGALGAIALILMKFFNISNPTCGTSWVTGPGRAVPTSS